jgi:hypothetical protein
LLAAQDGSVTIFGYACVGLPDATIAELETSFMVLL